MAILSDNDKLIAGAAGKSNSGGGGDYFSLGTHKVMIAKVEVAPSKKDEGESTVFIVEGIIVKGGKGTILYDRAADGKAIKKDNAGTSEAPRVGRRQANVCSTAKGGTKRFQENLGDFCLAAKKTFMNVYNGLNAESKEVFLTDPENGKGLSGPALERTRAFIKRAQANPDSTTGDDIRDILECELALNLVMVITVSQYKRKDEGLSGTTKWTAGSCEDLGLLRALDDNEDDEPPADDE